MKRKNFRETMSLSWLIFVESIKSFINNDSYQTAANLAYYGFFSLIPLLLLVVILLSNLTLSSEQVLKGTQTLAEEIMPQSSEVLLKEISTLAAKRIWGLYSMIALLWIIIPFASALRSAFAQVFKMEQTIGFVKEYLLSVVAAFALLVLFLVLVRGHGRSCRSITPLCRLLLLRLLPCQAHKTGTCHRLPHNDHPLLCYTADLCDDLADQS